MGQRVEIETIYRLDADISAQGCDSNPETEHILHHDDGVFMKLESYAYMNSRSLLDTQDQEIEKSGLIFADMRVYGPPETYV